MQSEFSDRPAAIETQEPLKEKRGIAPGGIITVYRLRYMSSEEIEKHGLARYVAGKNTTTKGIEHNATARRR